MSRRIAVVFGTLCLLVLSSPGSALADGCAALELDCIADTVTTTDPDEAVDDPVGTIDDVADGAEDTTDPVTDPVVDQVRDVVDDVLNGGGIIDPPVIDPPVIDPPGGDGPGVHHAGPGTRIDRNERPSGDRSTPSVPGPTAASREAFVPAQTLIGPAASGTRPPIMPGRAPGRFDGFVEGAVRGLLLLAVLFGVTVGFVMLQGRIDRNDPKLASAPVRAEVVTFG